MTIDYQHEREQLRSGHTTRQRMAEAPMGVDPGFVHHRKIESLVGARSIEADLHLGLDPITGLLGAVSHELVAEARQRATTGPGQHALYRAVAGGALKLKQVERRTATRR